MATRPRFSGAHLWLVFAALTWGAFSVLVRKVSANYPSLTITWYGFFGGLIVLVVLTVAGIFMMR